MINYFPLPTTAREGEPDRWTWEELNRLSTELQNQFPRWEDLRSPIILPGLGTDPSINASFGWHEFSVDDFVFYITQIPHAFKVGSTLKPHVHWHKITSASGNVRWQLDYRWSNQAAAMDAAWTTLVSETPAVSDGDTQYQHAITSLGDIASQSGTEVSNILVLKLSRVTASGSEYGADAGLLDFDMHYQIDSFGSEKEYEKT